MQRVLMASITLGLLVAYVGLILIPSGPSGPSVPEKGASQGRAVVVLLT